MKNKQNLFFGLIALFMISAIQLPAQLVEEVSISSEEANFKMIAPNGYLLEIGGPDDYYFRQEVEHTNRLSISNVKTDGQKFKDGSYTLQVTPIVTLTETERKELRTLSVSNDVEKLAAFRIAHNLPENVQVYNINFSIRNGEFVSSTQKEYRNLKTPRVSSALPQDHPSLYASIENIKLDYTKTPTLKKEYNPNTDNTLTDGAGEDDQVFLDDVIVDGSICVGQDCVNGENFGFDTGRYKENNLRVHFDDTSSSASFPSNDWRISINDSSNGGASYFAIEDATAGTVPFRVRAGAGNNALYISNSGGNVGMGTASPVVELHVTDGDSPTLRLEQNGQSGWTPQTWDIAGNETNFFVRDVTNGSKLPFKIRPGAPDNSLYVDSEGDIGLGTANPGTNALQVENGDVYIKAGNLGINKVPTAALDVLGVSKFEGTTSFTGDANFSLNTGATFFSLTTFGTVLRVDASTGRVGIGTASPVSALEVCGTISTTAATVSTGVTCSSDIRFKKNVQPLTSSLDKIMQIRGVSYNWKVADFPKKGFTEDKQIGFIAQEIETLIPELVKTDEQGYKAVDYAKITPVLVEAVKEQQTIINTQQDEIAALQKQVDELQGLKAQVAALTGMVSSLSETASAASENVEVETSGEKE